MKKKLSKSIRKFIRKEKARIHREVLDIEKQKNLIKELYQKFSTKKKLSSKKKLKTKKPKTGISLPVLFS